MSDWLDRLVGEWTYEAHPLPDDLLQRSSGSETVSRRGAWIVIESDDHARFQLAQDPATGRVSGDFISWDHPGLWVYDGAPDQNRMTLHCRGPRMDEEPGLIDYQDVWEIVSPDERTTTGRYRDDDGQRRDFNITRYRRKG